jgi:rfaE bifunctional protein nucleotidyltransferase chain/domain
VLVPEVPLLLEEAAARVEALRAAELRVVTTNGCFDLLHAGHLDILEKARSLGDFLIVLLNSDASVQALKGPHRPIQPEVARARLLLGLRAVDAVVIFDEPTPLAALNRLRPHVHVKGGSFVPEKVAAERALLESWGGTLQHFPLVYDGESGTSTSEGAASESGSSSPAWSSSRLIAAAAAALEGRPEHSRYPWIDLRTVSTISILERENLVKAEEFATLPTDTRLSALLDSLPLVSQRSNTAGSLRAVVRAILDARTAGRTISWAIGPQVVKYGLSRLIIALMERGFITALATTGAGAIHDTELAFFGATSEEMTGGIRTGTFGMARETGELLNGAARRARLEQRGFGEVLGEQAQQAPFAELSLLASSYKLSIPLTVHLTLGADIVHTHPSYSGADCGAATQQDFQIFAAQLGRLGQGGVHLNVASSVVLPEIFLKGLTVCNNLRAKSGEGALEHFMTVNIDHQSEYRPLMNVLRRPTVDVGVGIELLGRLELMLPLLTALLLEADRATEPSIS